MKTRIAFIALCIAIVCPQAFYPIDLLMDEIDNEFFVKSGGEELYIKVRGQNPDNPVLLFLHGGPGELTGPLSFQAYAGPGLEKHFVVGYLHQRNTCLSPPVPVETLTIDQFVKDVHNIVEFMREKFNQDKIFLVGHSFGGILGYMYLLEYGDDSNIEKFVSAAGAFSAASLEENGYKTTLEWAKKTDNQRALERLEKSGPPPYETLQEGMVWRMLALSMDRGMTKNYRLPKVLADTGIYKFDPEWQRKMITVGGTMWSDINTIDIEDDVKNISTPVLIIAGANDFMVPIRLMEKGYKNLGGKKDFFILENSNHMMYVDESDAFVSRIIEFFQE